MEKSEKILQYLMLPVLLFAVFSLLRLAVNQQVKESAGNQLWEKIKRIQV